jgi:hypothetical protein
MSGTDEVQYGQPDPVDSTAPDGKTVHGEIRFTSKRLMFTEAVDLKSLPKHSEGMIPERTLSIPWNDIRQCKFGMHNERLKFFSVTLNNGDEYSFGPIVEFNAEVAMKELKWTRKQVTGYTYWIA